MTEPKGMNIFPQARIKAGPFEFVPLVDYDQFSDQNEDSRKWVLPGGRHVTAAEINSLAERNNWDVRRIVKHVTRLNY